MSSKYQRTGKPQNYYTVPHGEHKHKSPFLPLLSEGTRGVVEKMGQTGNVGSA